jgi:hypothetical protein
MRTDKVWLVIGSMVMISIFAYALATGEAERRYEKYKDFAPMWFWLRFFHVPQTRENFVRFVNFTSWLAIVLCCVGTVIVVIWGI